MATITSWMKDASLDLVMDEQHSALWRAFIDSIKENDLSNKTIFDFGCNCGGFLRLLYNLKPFKNGIGIDMATNPIQVAKMRINGLPIEYHVADQYKGKPESVDIAFSHEVLFLLPDIKEHAGFIYQLLKPNGIYYTAIGCHTDNPLWKSWKPLLQNESVLSLYDYSPEEIVEAFSSQGFLIEAKRLNYQGFISMNVETTYYPKISDRFNYHQEHVLIFRCQKTGV